MQRHNDIQKKLQSGGRMQKRTAPFFNPAIQEKSAVSKPADVYEKEADAVAEKVMCRNASSGQPAFFSPVSIQRKCDECGEEEKNMQRKEINNKTAASSLQMGNYVSALSGGKPLNNEERTFFESRMGYDFSDVRIHNDGTANRSAKNINALAYTEGNNIVFGQGHYQPGTYDGKKLLAHELAHVVQQGDNDALLKKAHGMIQRAMDKDPSELDDDQLKSEYDAYNEYVHNIDPADYAAEEDAMNYFLALEKELKRRCIKSTPSHPKEVSQRLIDRITGKYASIDGDPGEGLFLTPYVASEGQCTIGYGHVIFPKSSCTIKTVISDEGKTKKTCECTSPWNAITKEQAIKILRQDMQKHINEVNNKIKVDLNQAEFDAMVDLSAHVGSMPSDFANFVNEKWCTNKEAVKDRYLRTAITMKDPDTKQYKVMQNFIDRRKRRAW